MLRGFQQFESYVSFQMHLIDCVQSFNSIFYKSLHQTSEVDAMFKMADIMFQVTLTHTYIYSTERFCYQFNAKCINREIIYTVFISCVKIWKIIFKHQKNGFIYEYWIKFNTIDKTHMTIMIIKEGCHHYEFLGIAALSG